ncbi:MAG TPA: hypothetical protein PKD05_05360 [Candidatus Melainabacteria bacterium]|nr:hypothetical protein [Candidatus Melainabacteria bacterium]
MEPEEKKDDFAHKRSALALAYAVPLLLGYGYFINEAVRMGGGEGKKIFLIIAISAAVGAIFFIYRSITAKKAGRHILDSGTTMGTLVLSIGLLLVLYACKDFYLQEFTEPVLEDPGLQETR